MELEYLKEKIYHWMERELGSFRCISVIDIEGRTEDMDGELITYCESCTAEVTLPNLSIVDYRVLVDWDNGELYYYRGNNCNEL